VTIGKELSERLYASVWTSVGAQSRQAVQLEYRVTRRVSLLGTWESGTAETAGAFGGDVKFRMEFLRAPFSLLCP
jgi:autotransporter translocation and assembly factor TamB